MKIDIVYSWGGINRSNNRRERYNYELEYSIKSVKKYLPWYNHIYILINSNTTIPKEFNIFLNKKISFINRCKYLKINHIVLLKIVLRYIQYVIKYPIYLIILFY